MESSRHVNCNRIIYWKGAVHRTEKDRVLILIYVTYIFYRHIMLLLVTCMSALLQARFPMSTDVHLKRFCMHKILCTKNYNLWRPIHDDLRDVPWEGIFKPSASAAASECCEWVQVRTDVYIPNCKYQVKPHSSPWLSAACLAAIIQKNHFFPFLPTK